MAAKLEWKGDELKLAVWTVAIVGESHGGWRFAIPDAERGVSSPYERRSDARQDCEAETRRLLREAGVEVA